MIYQEDIVWRVGQSSLDLSYVDYIVDLLDESVVYIRPNLRVFGTPLVDYVANTFTAVAPYSAIQDSTYEFYVYSREYLYSSGVPVAFSWSSLQPNGFAYIKNNKLYIVSGIFMRDYYISTNTFGNYAYITSYRRVLDAFHIYANHTSSTEQAGLAGLYDEERNPIFAIQVDDEVTVNNTDSNNIQTDISVTADSVCYTHAFKSGGYISVESNSYSKTEEVATGISLTDVFSVGNYMYDNWGNASITDLEVRSYVYTIGKYDFITRCGKLYDRSGYGNNMAVFTDDLSEMIKVIDGSFENSKIVCNIYPDRAVPCLDSDITVDCEGNPIGQVQQNKVNMCIFLTT